MVSTCRHTKHSQELLEYAIGTCPKDFNKQDKKHASTPLIRKKQVTFEKQCDTSNSNTHKYVEQLTTQATHVLVPPSTGVNCCTNASGSQPRSNTKKNRISLANGVNKKKVEEHPRTNKSNLRTTNPVYSSSSSKRTAPTSIHNIHNVVRKVKQVWKPKQVRQVVQIVLWYLDSGCSKHITGNRLRLRNFMKKFIGTVRFGNDHFGAIMGYGDYVIGDSVGKKMLFSRESAKSIPINHKPENTNLEVLNTLHMDLCGPMRVQTINGKKYILVIVDDYSRFTWVKFLRSKDETPEVVIKFLKQIQVGLNKTVRYVRTDNGTEFVNKDLTEYMNMSEFITKRQFRRLHSRTTLSKDETVPLVFGALCYPTNDSDDLGKLQPTIDIGIFVGYAPSRKGSVSPALAVSVLVNLASTPSSTTVDQDAPSPSHSPSSSALQSLNLHQGVASESTLIEDNTFAPVDNHPFINIFALEPSYEASSSGILFS
ncbi:integrase, catalytic region, zinc finger, CCHC-type containing protein [Tanacetum coccineum]